MVEMRKCNGDCGLEKKLNKDNFTFRKDQNKFINQCKICEKEYHKKYRKENKEKIQKNKNKYYAKNKDEINKNYKQYYQENEDELKKYQKQYREEHKNESKQYQKEYRKTHKQEKNEYHKDRTKNDPEYKLKNNIARSVYEVLKHKKGGKSVLKHLPYTMEELRKHIEDQFKTTGNEWMTWENWGKYNPKTHNKNRTWNLDHIKAHSKFKYTTMDCQEFKDCWALSNLQPLDSKENILKGNK